MVQDKLHRVDNISELEEKFACRGQFGEERCLTQGGICDSMKRKQYTHRDHQWGCNSLKHINDMRGALGNIEAKLTNIVSLLLIEICMITLLSRKGCFNSVARTKFANCQWLFFFSFYNFRLRLTNVLYLSAQRLENNHHNR